MPNSENQPAPKYNKDYFNAAATARNYEKRLKDPSVSGYNKWMIGRRLGDYAYFADLQDKRVHVVSGVSHGKSLQVFCSCGLTVDFSPETDTDFLPFEGLAAPGHWDHHAKAPAQVFVLGNNLVCAGCDRDQPVKFEGEGDLEREPIVDWDATLDAHADCGFGRWAVGE